MNDLKFGAGDKLTWIEQVARDRGCSGFDVRVTIEIARHTNTKTGEAAVSQATIGNILGKSDRWVRNSFKNLFQRGHGERVLSGHGPGKPEKFRPIILRRPLSGEHRNSSSGEQRNRASSDLAEQGKYPSAVVNEQGKDCAPTEEDLCSNTGSYTSAISTKIPTEIPEEHAWDGDGGRKWRAVKRRLAERLGRDVAEAWFSNVGFERFAADGTVWLNAPKFIAHRIENNFSDALRDAWRASDPAITSVKFNPVTMPPATDWRSARDRGREALAELRLSVERDENSGGTE